MVRPEVCLSFEGSFEKFPINFYCSLTFISPRHDFHRFLWKSMWKSIECIFQTDYNASSYSISHCCTACCSSMGRCADGSNYSTMVMSQDVIRVCKDRRFV